MIPLTKLGSLGLVWVFIALPMLFSEKLRVVGFKVILAVLITGFVGEGIIKNLAKRKRPSKYIEESDMLIRKPVTYSFPSGHTSSSFASATVISHYCSNLMLPTFILALLVSFSRLYLKVHYPSDIFAGAVFGLISALAIIYFI